MKRRFFYTALTLVLALAFTLAGCGGKPTGAPTGTGDSKAPAASSSDQTADDKVIELDPSVDLFTAAGVKSYRMRMAITYSGAALTDSAMNMKVQSEQTSDPKAVHYRIEGGGSDGNAEMVRIEDTMWMKMGAQWTQLQSPDAKDFTSDFAYKPSDMNGMSSDLKRVGIETVNGRKTVHYHADTSGLTELALYRDNQNIKIKENRSDFWMDPAGFMVKGEVVAAATNIDSSKPDAEGRVVWTYELYDFGASIKIEPPTEQLTLKHLVRFELQMPPGAKTSMLTEFGGNFTTKSAMADVSKFFQDQLKAVGIAYEMTMESAEMTGISFKSPDGKSFMILLSPGQEGTTIAIAPQ